MSGRSKLTVALAMAGMFSLVVTAGDEKPQAEDEGAKLLTKVCAGCHKIEMVTSHRGTRDEWRATVEAMVTKGADASDDDFNAVIDYLTKNYGPDSKARFNVNSATAGQIAAFFAIPEAQGASIVNYRSTNGKFKTFQDVLKAPGVDAKKIEAKKDLLTY